ncbi:MAG: hypoxanthine phosphoribosyltransferase [Candidatus Bipolaricaulota bacterium]|nr:hypoxanthine phosphoribosyltransferase [Candidatus Bipolaricaulota bacterium]MCS7274939.1 hypoxanthine phosphoribosyltransferase [Candidatus Bipolaricaulota bacterium]MDW8110554.1 hypoxanthine phosphoribosyltransferase [Candidatus Bipolaricaulota bacterium]MDW8329812.1 hypoxanthine phosphoribosyltransferase [Candidatus Bipolaricaulota bacterium]
MHNEIERILFTEDQIAARVRELGQQISRDYEQLLGERISHEPPLAIGLLRGAVIFLADLARAMPIPLELAFMALSSYGRSTSPGEVRVVKDLEIPVAGRHLLIVEDIVDTGQTLAHLTELLRARHPASVKICTLLDKTPRRTRSIKLDYVGFTLPEDAFVVGYGLDYAERYRNLPYIAALKQSATRS